MLKEQNSDKDIIIISISDFLTNELAQKISLLQWHTYNPKYVNKIKEFIYEGKYLSDCFNVVATNAADDVIGWLYCLKSQENPKLWYYGNLFISPNYRKLKIGTKMVEAAQKKLIEQGAEVLRCYVDSLDTVSIHFQKSIGFKEKPYENFNSFLNKGNSMFELILTPQFEVIPATINEAIFVYMFYTQNIDALHGKEIPLSEWKKILEKDDPDEQNFLICRGVIPLAWLRINGLLNNDMAWISMLIVTNIRQHQGIGTFAVRFAEDYAKSKGFIKMGIHTTDDNIPAQNLYKKCGYTITEYGNCTTGDGVGRKGYTFEKVF